MRVLVFAVLPAVLFLPLHPAHADCSSPAGVAGAMDYFGAPDNTFKFCDGAQWVNMRGDSGVPSGAVMAFHLTVCPPGWSEYIQARGRFLRGIDNGAGNDPSGTRAPGSVQADEFKSHTHGGGNNLDGVAAGGNQRMVLTGLTGAAGGPETRPKNVAVLFCRKA